MKHGNLITKRSQLILQVFSIFKFRHKLFKRAKFFIGGTSRYFSAGKLIAIFRIPSDLSAVSKLLRPLDNRVAEKGPRKVFIMNHRPQPFLSSIVGSKGSPFFASLPLFSLPFFNFCPHQGLRGDCMSLFTSPAIDNLITSQQTKITRWIWQIYKILFIPPMFSHKRFTRNALCTSLGVIKSGIRPPNKLCSANREVDLLKSTFLRKRRYNSDSTFLAIILGNTFPIFKDTSRRST